MPKYEIGQAVYLVIPQLVEGGKIYITSTITGIEEKEGISYYLLESDYLNQEQRKLAYKEEILHLTVQSAKYTWKKWLDNAYKQVCEQFDKKQEVVDKQ
jgi:hypothetical protein